MRSKVTTTRHVTAMPPQGIRNRPHSSSIEKGETVHVHFREPPMESKRRSPILILEKSHTGAHRRHTSMPPQTPSYFLKGGRKGGGGEEELGLMTSESQGIEMEKMAVGSIHVYRDIGTQMTPPGSSGTSACPTPRPLAMPSGAVLRVDYARKDGPQAVPMRTPPHPSQLRDTFCGHSEKDIKNCDIRKPKCGATLMRSSEEDKEEEKEEEKEEDEEEDIRQCPRRSRDNNNNYNNHYNKNNKSNNYHHHHKNNDNGEAVEKTTFKETFRVWEEAERARCIARSEREEARIQAWEEQKKAQALEKLKKLQIKVKKMQQKGEEKTTRKIMAAERQARQMRAATKAREAVALDKAKHHFMNSMQHQEQEPYQPQPQPQHHRFSYCCCPWPHRKSLP